MSAHVRWFSSWLLLCCSGLLSACGSPPPQPEARVELGVADPSSPRPPEGARSLERRVPSRHLPARSVAAWTDAGELALFDSLSGEVVARAAGGSFAAVGRARDLAWDRYAERLLVFHGDGQDQGGEITTASLDLDGPAGPWLGEVQHRAWVAGRARLWPAAGGIVVFEEGYGLRWKLLRDDGVPIPSIYAPRPASVWDQVHADGLELHALTHGSSPSQASAHFTRAWITPFGIDEVCTERWDVAVSTVPLTARMVPLDSSDPARPSQRVLMVDLVLGHPALRMISRGVAITQWQMGAGPSSQRIEHALIMPGRSASGRRHLAALLSGPSRLLLASFDGELAHVRAHLLSLPGQVRVQDRFFSRDLIAVDPTRVLVATDRGVWAVSIADGETGVHAVVDERFDGTHLRGPLACPRCG